MRQIVSKIALLITPLAFSLAVPFTGFLDTPDANKARADDQPAAISLTSQTPSPVLRTPGAQAALYPDAYQFTVYRKGKKIGTHDVVFTQKGDQLTVYNDLRLRVKFLFVTAYKLDYESTEIWDGDQLQFVDGFVNDNGEKLKMAASLEGDTFKWQSIYGDENSLPKGADYFPTNHWYVSVLDETQLLNTLTGKLINVGITSQGFEEIETEDGPLIAERFHYSGDLNSKVWYDQEGRWVGLEFYGRDGTAITYRCKGCIAFKDRSNAQVSR